MVREELIEPGLPTLKDILECPFHPPSKKDMDSSRSHPSRLKAEREEPWSEA